MKRNNFTLTKDAEKQLIELKELTGLTKSDLVRRAIEKIYKEKIEKEGK